ncbi:S8 family serine peptidase [Streptococcus hillyeri]|uniref:S8 family serine peptidase n=1 Tax=Streptococcus hillyeri TaxID=2282420 RepID=UPI0034E1A585
MKHQSYKKRKWMGVTLMATSVLLWHSGVASANQISELGTEEVSQPVFLPVPEKAEVENSEAAVSESALVSEESSDTAQEKASTVQGVTPEVNDLWQAAGKGAGTAIAVIDAGIDLSHEAFQGNSSESGLYPTKEALEAKKKEAGIDRGQWHNEKIVYSHDYSSNVKVTDTDHGTHVAGIVAGQSKHALGNQFVVEGLSPEAQLLFMRTKLAGRSQRLENSKQYAQAIKDAVALGATAINMSFGNTAEAEQELSEEALQAIKEAKEKGVAIVVSAGNDGAFGGYDRKPSAENPDFGIIGTPATSENVLTVASYVPEKLVAEVVTVTTPTTEPKRLAIQLTAPLDNQKAYSFVVLKEGEQADYSNQDVAGKIVIVNRGGALSFAEKMAMAAKHKAAGIIIVNHLEGRSLESLPQGDIPAGFMTFEDGVILKGMTDANLTFTGDYGQFTLPKGAYMDDFSSWGLTADGHMKPDITAPGHGIYSSISGNKYEPWSGTSMATPHVTAVMNLLLKHVETKFAHLNLTPEKRLELAKALLMSTANPIKNVKAGTFISPRQQGAGALDLSKVVKSDTYVTGNGQQTKIHLNDVATTFEIPVMVHNLGDTPKTFDYHATVMSDQVSDKAFTLSPQHVLDTAKQRVIVAPRSSQLVTLKVDVSSADQKLQAEMPNGYFLDGFVQFKAVDAQGVDMSIPFVGFRGNFADLPAAEEAIYNRLEGTFYYQPQEKTNEFDLKYGNFVEKGFTALKSHYKPWSAVGAGLSDEDAPESEVNTVLGSYEKIDDENKRLLIHQGDKPYLAISPNEDGNMDTVTFQGTFFRNAKGLKAQVLDKETGDVIWESDNEAIAHKNYNKSDEVQGAVEYTNTSWDGTNKDGETVANGTYIYRVLYTPMTTGAKEQHMDFEIMVNVTKPALPQVVNYNKETRQLTVSQPEVTGLPIYRQRLAFLSLDEEEGLYSVVYLPIAEDGTVTIPEMTEDDIEITLENVSYVVEDMAGNYNQMPLLELIEKGKAPEIMDEEKEPEVEFHRAPEVSPHPESKGETQPEAKDDKPSEIAPKLDDKETKQEDKLSSEVKSLETGSVHSTLATTVSKTPNQFSRVAKKQSLTSKTAALPKTGEQTAIGAISAGLLAIGGAILSMAYRKNTRKR